MEDYSKYSQKELIAFLVKRDAKIADLTLIVENKTKEITDLKIATEQKDERIAQQRKTLEVQGKEITDLKIATEQKDKRIAQQREIMLEQDQAMSKQTRTINSQKQVITNKDLEIEKLKKEIEEIQQGSASTAMEIINSLQVLTEDERTKLNVLVRTKPEGINASVIFNYGKAPVPPKQTYKDAPKDAPKAKK